MTCLKRLKILLREWKEWNGKVFEMKDLDEMKEINLNLAFDITFAITKAMFPCEMEDGGSKKEQFVFNDKYDIKATVLWNYTEKRGYSIKS